MVGKASSSGPHGTREVSDSRRLVTRPLVSVLMLVYNHAEYLAEAIQSVVQQQCEHPFELVVGDDASTDASLEIALDFQSRHPGLVRVLTTDVNVGMARNYRRLISAARGELVAWCEGDDYWCSKDKLALQSRILLSDSRIGVVHTDWVRARRHGGQWQVDWSRTMHRHMPDRRLEGSLLCTFYDSRILRTCTLMLRTDILDEMLGTELGTTDYRFCDTVSALFATRSWRVAYLPEITAVYRESPNSALRSGIAARMEFLKSALQFDSDARAFMGVGTDYPEAYRLEVAVGLFLWACKAGDWASASGALKDIRAHYPMLALLRTGCEVMLSRMPTLLKRRRALTGAQK